MIAYVSSFVFTPISLDYRYEPIRRVYNRMVVQLRPRAITVDRGSRGFGLSLIYRGLDKYAEQDTGIFVARSLLFEFGGLFLPL